MALYGQSSHREVMVVYNSNFSESLAVANKYWRISMCWRAIVSAIEIVPE